MNEDINRKIDFLKQRIDSGSFLKGPRLKTEWGGADVVIRNKLHEKTLKWLGRQNIVLSFQKNEPRRRAVITEFSKELSWTFIRLRNIFSGNLNYISKYDFYGSLAQAAIDYIEDSGEHTECKQLLYVVLNAARNFNENEIT